MGVILGNSTDNIDTIRNVVKGNPTDNIDTIRIALLGDYASPILTSFNNVGIVGLNPSASVVGYLKGISLGWAPTSVYSDGTFGRHMQTGITKSISEGSPNSPSLQISHPGMWRFRWAVGAGFRSISIRVKQETKTNGVRPTLTIKANPEVGLLTDVSGSAANGNDWTTIGPLTFTATAAGAVFVEMANNLNYTNIPAYFDHIHVE